MHLDQYVEQLRDQLLAAADSADSQASDAAARLLLPLEATVRLVLLGAVTEAADEITAELAPGSVEVRLRGLDPEFVVSTAIDAASTEIPIPVRPADQDGEDATVSRTTLRLPEHLKLRAEAAAAAQGMSVNAWLVRAVSAHLERPPRPPASPHTSSQRLTGWVS